MKTKLIALWLLFGLSLSGGSLFQATPLVDYQAGQLYLGIFPGLLYHDPVSGLESNTVPKQHESDGLSYAAQVQPLDANGNPSATGKIVFVALGMSNWDFEICGLNVTPTTCASYSFVGQAKASSSVNPAVVIADCAHASYVAYYYINDYYGVYDYCMGVLSSLGITRQQVQVILYKDASAYLVNSLKPTTNCANPHDQTDACNLLRWFGQTARYWRSGKDSGGNLWFPNLKQAFWHTRTYGGWVTSSRLNHEPYAYEIGFAAKWLIRAQINQIAGQGIDPAAGDLSYTAAPWIAWGPYWWAPDDLAPCQNCQTPGLVWLRTDFSPYDGQHPTESGCTKVAQMLMSFYLKSEFSPWFRTK